MTKRHQANRGLSWINNFTEQHLSNWLVDIVNWKTRPVRIWLSDVDTDRLTTNKNHNLCNPMTSSCSQETGLGMWTRLSNRTRVSPWVQGCGVHTGDWKSIAAFQPLTFRTASCLNHKTPDVPEKSDNIALRPAFSATKSSIKLTPIGFFSEGQPQVTMTL